MAIIGSTRSLGGSSLATREQLANSLRLDSTTTSALPSTALDARSTTASFSTPTLEELAAKAQGPEAHAMYLRNLGTMTDSQIFQRAFRSEYLQLKANGQWDAYARQLDGIEPAPENTTTYAPPRSPGSYEQAGTPAYYNAPPRSPESYQTIPESAYNPTVTPLAPISRTGITTSSASGVQSSQTIAPQDIVRPTTQFNRSGFVDYSQLDPTAVLDPALIAQNQAQHQVSPGVVANQIPAATSRIQPGTEGTSAFPVYSVYNAPDHTLITYPTESPSPGDYTAIVPPTNPSTNINDRPGPGGSNNLIDNLITYGNLMPSYYQWGNNGPQTPGTYSWQRPTAQSLQGTIGQTQTEYDRILGAINRATNEQERTWAWQDYNRMLAGSSLGLGIYNQGALDPLAQLQQQLQQQYNPNFMNSLTGQQDFSGLLRQREGAIGQQLNQQAAGMGVQGMYAGLLGEQQRARDALAGRAQAAYNPLAIQTQKQYQQGSDELLNAINQAEMEAQRVFATSGV